MAIFLCILAKRCAWSTKCSIITLTVISAQETFYAKYIDKARALCYTQIANTKERTLDV